MKEIYKNIRRKKDGSFVVEKEGYPYHIPDNEEFAEEYKMINEYIAENPSAVSEYVEPVMLTEEEIFEKMTTEEKSSYIRKKRDNLINNADVLLLKYEEQVELSIITQDDKYRLALLQYKEDLRNIPEPKGFPENVVWPELPVKEE